MNSKIFIVFIVVLSFSVRPLFFVGHCFNYYLNKEAIIEKYCENKTTPKLHCEGKCHLKKQLSIKTDSSKQLNNHLENYIPFFPLYYQENSKINLSKYQVLGSKQLILENQYLKVNSFHSDILRPPISVS